MKIISLLLENYRGFRLRQIKRFLYHPTQKTQVVLGSNGSGKAQPLTSLIKTPGGWETLGEMKVGSKVIAKDGCIAHVTGVFPQGKQQIYKLAFADDRVVRATGDHLWKLYVGGYKYPIVPKIVTTEEIIRLSKTNRGHLLWIDLIDSEQNEDADLPIDPYVLGVILGDGCCDTSVVITNPDEFIAEKVKSKLLNGLTTSMRSCRDNHCLTYGLVNETPRPGRGSNYITAYLRQVGLLYKRSYEKFIPEIYLNASTQQRLALLQGLMDTDGTIDKQGTSSYCTTSWDLAVHVQYLIRSLGGIATIAIRSPSFTYKGEKRLGRRAYQINIRYKKPSELFTLPKKKDRSNDNNQYAATLKLRIVSVEKDGVEEAQCIAIDHPDHLYVTNGFTVTHNTSLVRELSPLPANPIDFERNGRKEIEVQHNGKHYLLQSIFDEEGSRYAFICDGENLNPGYTVTVYRELVKQHFNYTQDIHSLLTGKTRFTSMSVNDRRNWFTRISDVDYTYAIDYHKRLKESIRNLQGALKRNQDRLVKETEKCLTPRDEDALRTTVTELNKSLDLLLEHRKPRLLNTASLQRDIDQTEVALSRATAQLERLLEETEAMTSLPDIDSLNAQYASLNGQVQAIQAELVRRCEFLEGLNKELQAASVSSTASLADVQQSIKQLEEEYSETYRRLKYSFQYSEPSVALSVLDSITERLTSILTSLADLPHLKYFRDDYQCLIQSRVTIDQELKKVKAAESQLFSQIQVFEAAKAKAEVDCPNCRHRWHPGYDEPSYRKLVIQREHLLKAVETHERHFADLDKKVKEHEVFFGLMNDYNQVVHHASILDGECGVWKYVETSGLLSTEPCRLVPFFAAVQVDIKYSIQLSKIKAQIEEQKKLEQLMLNAGKIDTEKLKQRAHQENEAILSLQSKLRTIQDSHRTIKAQISTYTSMQTLKATISAAMTSRTQQYSELIEDRCIAALDEMIRSLKVEVNQHERTLSQVDIQKGIVQSLGVEIKSIDRELVLLKRAQKALSPSEGLIARGMIAFINHFVQQLNEFIGKIWLYPLTIQSLDLSGDDDVDLDYKFKMLVNDDLETPDVAMTSKGMQEVIDLAFVVVSMRYLGLSNFPVFLDEFAASFDVAHRQAAYKAIDLLIDSTDYSQVFLVSHYQAGYSSLTAAEVLVLCDSNVELPAHMAYNQHVSMH